MVASDTSGYNPLCVLSTKVYRYEKTESEKLSSLLHDGGI